MVKKIKKELSEFPFWMWAKRIFWSILVLMIAGGAGTFYPNPLAKKWANEELRQEHTKWAQNLGLVSKTMKYKTKKEFIKELGYCVDYINFTTPVDKRVPIEMLVGQAVLESGWGNSRFAVQGNNLFGIRTWTESTPHLLPQGIEKWPGWGVRAFASKCDSVKEYVRLLNEHNAYKEFREMRSLMLSKNQQLDSFKLIKTLDKFSTTKDYDQRVIRMIKRIRKLEEKK